MTSEKGPVGRRTEQEPTSYGLQPPAASALPQQRPETVADPRSAPERGRLVGGRYRLLDRLGYGGMGTVWKAHDEVVDRDVAAKEPRIPDHLNADTRDTVYRRMQREARSAARVDHPSVVTIHDVVTADGRPWIVMELVRGRSLADALDEGLLSPQEAARIALPVLGALGAAHAAGVLHRDIKPGNVLLGPYDRVVLTDFGIAQVEGEEKLTETGAFVGSPEYIAPERVLGQKPGPPSDLFSLGVLLYTAVEGFSPFRRSATPATLQAVIGAEPQPPVRAGEILGPLILQLLRKDPAARPSTEQAVKVLGEIAGTTAPAFGSPEPDRATTSVLTRSVSAVRTSRKARFAVLGTVLAVTAAALAFVVLPREPEVPAGWKYQDETARVRATLAVPKDYKRSADENEVAFIDPAVIYTVRLQRIEKITASALDDANTHLQDYEDGAKFTVQEATGTVTEADYQGRPAADLTVTYQPYSASDGEQQLMRREFYYVNRTTDTEWRLIVEMPSKGSTQKAGEQIFDDAVSHLNVLDAEPA